MRHREEVQVEENRLQQLKKEFEKLVQQLQEEVQQ